VAEPLREKIEHFENYSKENPSKG